MICNCSEQGKASSAKHINFVMVGNSSSRKFGEQKFESEIHGVGNSSREFRNSRNWPATR